MDAPIPVVAPVTRTTLACRWKSVCMGKKRGQAIPIAPLRPPALAAFRPWGVKRELAVGDLPSVDKGRTVAVPLYAIGVDIEADERQH